MMFRLYVSRIMDVSIFIVILTLGFNIVKYANADYEFGCYFDGYYDTNLSLDLPEHGDYNRKIVTFSSKEKVINWYKTVSQQYKEFIEKQEYNTVEPILNFYDNCRKHSGSLETCYNNFKPKFLTSIFNSFYQENSKLAVMWLKKMKKEYSSYAPAFYLTASQWRPYNGTKDPEPYSTAAFMAFEVIVDGEETVRGLFLFDPGFLNDVVAVVDDEKARFVFGERDAGIIKSSIWKDAGQTVKFSYRHYYNKDDQKWIVGKPQKPTAEERGNIVYYYVSQPYCSFLRHSVKPALLSPKKVILQRDSAGTVMAALSVDLYPVNDDPQISLYYYRQKEGLCFVLDIPVNGNTENFMNREGNSEFITRVAKRLRIKRNHFMTEIIDKLIPLLKNKAFLRDLATLGKAWGVDSDRGPFWDMDQNSFVKFKPKQIGLVV